MIKFFKNLFDPSVKNIKSVKPIVEQINKLEAEYEKKSTEELSQIISTIRAELKALNDAIPNEYKTSLKVANKNADYVAKEEKLKSHLLSKLPEVYAVIIEIHKRYTGMKPFQVQLTSSTLLAQGYKLTECKTGEGKTLIFQLPAALYGLTGRGSHVVTVNDYLAKLHGEYAGHVLSHIGLTVGVITPQQSYRFVSNEDVKLYKGEEIGKNALAQRIISPGDCDGLNLLECSKKEAYDCDIVYGTNNEFGFDYLRDNMTYSRENISQRELYFCIVDEADSILIDEARTPLIISSQAEKSNDLYIRFAQLVPRLTKDTDYTVDEKAHSVVLTEDGAEKMERLLGVRNIWQDYQLAHHLENALKANELYKKDIHYLVNNGEVLIVDEFTGRVLEGRRYSEGLHQAIEAKEGVEIKRESKTLGTITFQNFFRLYKILSGGSGTVMTETEEFYKIYNLTCVEVPTNRPVARKDYTDRVYKNRQAKFEAVANDVVEIHKNMQPILIGTTSIEDSEYVSKLLEQRGIEHEVLNAKYHEKESKIVANAGAKGAVTVSTNMAGRGTDIKLGGRSATQEQFEEVVSLGGLFIMGTQRHESRRIDNQLRGRAGRQGEPGESRFYVALDDEIMRIQGGEFIQKVMSMTNLPDDMPLETGLIGRSIENAQKRMEGMHFDSRKTVVEYDDVVNQQREIFYSRRRRILDEIENAEEFIKNLKPDEKLSDKEGNPIHKLEDTLFEKVKSEITSIVDTHSLNEKGDKFDTEKMIDAYLDLAHDELFRSAAVKKGIASHANESIKTVLNNKLKGLKYDEIVSILSDLAHEVYKTKLEEFGKDLPIVSKVLTLRTMDDLWTEHLDAMKDLREGIGLRGFAQQDPLVEYKNEGFTIFENFVNNIDSQIARRVMKVQKVITPQIEPEEEVKTNETEIKDISTGSREIASVVKSVLSKKKDLEQVHRTEPQKTLTNSSVIGRNDLCPCGSGLKYKKCGLINSPEHKQRTGK